MSRKHEYKFYDGQIPSFMWQEKGTETEHSLHLGGSLVIDFAEGRIVGFEICDLNISLRDGLKDRFQDTNEIEIRTEQEILNDTIKFTPEGTPVCPDCNTLWTEKDNEEKTVYTPECDCLGDGLKISD